MVVAVVMVGAAEGVWLQPTGQVGGGGEYKESTQHGSSRQARAETRHGNTRFSKKKKKKQNEKK